MALERALEADPGYTMALLIRDAIAAGLPPSAARLPMTPEEVAASYGEAGDKRSRSAKRERPAGITRDGTTGSVDPRPARKRPSG